MYYFAFLFYVRVLRSYWVFDPRVFIYSVLRELKITIKITYEYLSCTVLRVGLKLSYTVEWRPSLLDINYSVAHAADVWYDIIILPIEPCKSTIIYFMVSIITMLHATGATSLAVNKQRNIAVCNCAHIAFVAADVWFAPSATPAHNTQWFRP